MPRWLAFAAAGAMALALAADSQAAPRSFFGLSSQTALTPRDVNRMGQAQVGTLRLQVPWPYVDAAAPVGGYDWSSVDPIIAVAARNGIDVLPFFYGTPYWVARDMDGYSCGDANCQLYAPRSEQARAAFAAFVRAAVERYGHNGTFWRTCGCPPRPVRAWQVWNEQNSATFYKPKPKPKAYAKLLGAAAKAVRPQDPTADVLLGGMAELAGVPNVIDGSVYLKKLYDVKGVKGRFDAVATHPYAVNLSGVRRQVELVRSVMAKAKDKRAPLWITEIGWGSGEDGEPLNRGLDGQAQMLRGTYRYMAKKRGKYNMKSVVWFSWMDSPAPDVCAWCGLSGLLTATGLPKPAWNVFTQLTGGS